MTKNKSSLWDGVAAGIPGELMLILLPVIIGVWGLNWLFRFLADLLRDSPSRQLVAAGILILAADFWASLAQNPVGHILAATLTLLAWGRWRSKERT